MNRKTLIKRTFAGRILSAAKLESRLYEELEMDPGAFKQAAAVVLLSSLAGGLGTPAPAAGFEGFAWGVIAALLGWIVWVSLIYIIGLKLLAGPLTYSNAGGLLRAAGFASAPGLIRILGVFPPVQTFVFWIALVWMLAAMVIAVRQALDYSSTAQALGVCFAGWLLQALLGILWLHGSFSLLLPA